MSLQCYLTFPSTYHAIRAEKTLAEKNLSFKMVPVPRKISSSCGISLRCPPEIMANVVLLLEEADVEIEGKHELEENSKNRRGRWF